MLAAFVVVGHVEEVSRVVARDRFPIFLRKVERIGHAAQQQIVRLAFYLAYPACFAGSIQLALQGVDLPQ